MTVTSLLYDLAKTVSGISFFACIKAADTATQGCIKETAQAKCG